MAAKPKWPVTGFAAAFLGAAGSVLHHFLVGPVPHFIVYFLVVVFSAWLGAAAGAVFDWLTARRSPMTPLFPGRFDWYYRLGLWLRFAAAFSSGWLISAFMVVLYLAVWGEPEDLGAFFSPRGLLAIGILAAVYAFIGAVIGGLASLAKVIFGTGAGDN